MIKKIGVLTGGGDCPGLNTVLRAVIKSASKGHNISAVGFLDGYDGLVRNKYRTLNYDDVSGILTQGGTILGTSNIANPYRFFVKRGKKFILQDRSKDAIRVYKNLKLDALVCIGGDGTLSIAYKLAKDGLNIVGVPKTIDNDLIGTDKTFGVDTAVSVATEAIDRLHSTAQSHHRVMIVELMGRYAGWISLYSGIAGGGDVILIPEIPYNMDSILKVLKQREKTGRRFTIIVAAEGAKQKGGKMFVKKMVESSTDPVRLGGIGMNLAEVIEQKSGQECRVVVLGHLQRGGSPIPSDRILASQYGYEALNMVVNKEFGNMVGLKNGRMVKIPLQKVAGKIKTVTKNHRLINMAKSIGVSFGDD
ncbi:6-phosphofructokinase [bacterium]